MSLERAQVDKIKQDVCKSVSVLGGTWESVTSPRQQRRRQFGR